MEITQIKPAVTPATDQDRAKEFPARVLGFEAGVDDGNGLVLSAS